MALSVIGAGFGRTGTDSMKEALEILYKAPCYHMIEVFKHKEHVQVWQDAVDGKSVDWDKLFAGYVCAVDWPVSRYWKVLSEKYPAAKVVLTIRPFEDWYASASETIYVASSLRKSGFGTRFMAMLVPFVRRFMRMASLTTFDDPKTFAGRFEDKEHARKVYEAHIAEVKKTLPADRLLVFQVSEGWEPLCKFLGKPVPSVPFPRVNDRASFKSMMAKREWAGRVAAAVAVGLTAILARTLWTFYLANLVAK